MKNAAIKALLCGTLLTATGLSSRAQVDTTQSEHAGEEKEITLMSKDAKELELLAERMKESALEMQKAVQRQNEKMAEVNRQLAEGQMTLEAAQKARAQIVEETEKELERIEEQMERDAEEMSQKADQMGEGESEAWARRWEEEARRYDQSDTNDVEIFDFDMDEDDFEWDWYDKKNSPRKTNVLVDFHLGINNLYDSDFKPIGGKGELDVWKSNIYEFGVHWKTRLGSPESKFYIKYGLSYTWHDFTLRGKNIIAKAQDSVYFTEADAEYNVKHTEYRNGYLNIPVMFQLDLSDGGMDKAFTLGLGGYGGLCTYFKREIKFSDAQNDDAREELRGDFYANPWRYGLLAQVGFNSFKITAQYDLNPFFDMDKAPEYRNLALTVGWSF
ncbi:outer membrane beta-barrel protein [bacterium]|nr:outer membrane beta-barrel protein [bacterium]